MNIENPSSRVSFPSGRQPRHMTQTAPVQPVASPRHGPSGWLGRALGALSLALIGGGAVVFLCIAAADNDQLPIGDFPLPPPVALQDGRLTAGAEAALVSDGLTVAPLTIDSAVTDRANDVTP